MIQKDEWYYDKENKCINKIRKKNIQKQNEKEHNNGMGNITMMEWERIHWWNEK